MLHLWGYNETQSKMVWFRWDKVHRPKREGGFDIREILSWNKTLLMKWLYKLVLNRRSLWTDWVRAYIIKDDDIWTATSSAHSSFTWRAILKTRDYFVANQGGIASATLALETWSKGDHLVLGKIYNSFRISSPVLNWTKVVWSPANMGRHAVIACLARQNSLATVDNLQKRGFCLANRYSLCEKDTETGSHLFFECPFSSSLMQKILHWTGIHRRHFSLARELAWHVRFSRGTQWRKQWRRCALVAVVYEIWKERNARIFLNRRRSIDQILFSVKFSVSVRIFALKIEVIEEELINALVN